MASSMSTHLLRARSHASASTSASKSMRSLSFLPSCSWTSSVRMSMSSSSSTWSATRRSSATSCSTSNAPAHAPTSRSLLSRQLPPSSRSLSPSLSLAHSRTFTTSTPARSASASSSDADASAAHHAGYAIRVHRDEHESIILNGPMHRIRNFSIIAHIDHGKSTLADRLLELAGNINPLSKEEAQVLDNLQVERERGITVKAQTATVFYRHPADGETYVLNLIDTPGHVDFSYEVSRSLAACHGALLLVDASQGIQAQTLANYYQAKEAGLDIIPVMTKMDLPHADPVSVAEEMKTAFQIDPDTIIHCSAKTGLGIDAIFPRIVDKCKPPSGASEAPLRALLFDSWYDHHRGVVCLVHVVDGEIRKGDKIATYHGHGQYDVVELGVLMPRSREMETLRAGQVGYLIAGIKSTREARLGDTFYRIGSKKQRGPVGQAVWQQLKDAITPLPGFKPAKSMVFAGLFPAQSSEFESLSSAIEKLTLNDASVQVEKESSMALGLGYRCGFLGVLHMDVFSSRLEQEFNASVIITAPTVPYIAYMRGKPKDEPFRIDSPAKFPIGHEVESYAEPWVRAMIITPAEHVGGLMELCGTHRGVLDEVVHLNATRVQLVYRLPMAEVVIDFYDQVKTISSGYASFDYEECGYEPSDLAKVDIRLNGESVDALSVICHKDKAETLGRKICAKLRETIDRQSFEIVIQAAVGPRILARERLAPYRKDVLTKSGKTVGGGDVSRKRKLLEKQKEGKKRMKMVGNVELNEEAFTAVMRLDKT